LCREDDKYFTGAPLLGFAKSRYYDENLSDSYHMLRNSEKRLAYVRVTLPQRQATKHLDTADFHNVTFFEKQKTDITFLQETYSTPEIIMIGNSNGMEK